MTVNENAAAAGSDEVIQIQPTTDVDGVAVVGVDQQLVRQEWFLKVFENDKGKLTGELYDSRNGEPGEPIKVVNLVFDKKKYIFEAVITIHDDSYQFYGFDPVNLNKSARNITLITLDDTRRTVSLCFKSLRNELANLTFNFHQENTPEKRIKSLDPEVIIIRK